MKIPSSIKALILDLDGVLWKDQESIGNLPAIFKKIEEHGLKVTLATNNSTQPKEERLSKLESFGVNIEKVGALTSSIATAALLIDKFPEGGELYVVGMEGILDELKLVGFRTFTESNIPEKPLAVVVGMDWGLNYEKIANASMLIQGGAPFYATNPDKTFPTPAGLMPGAGTLLAAVETASGVSPIVAGKPNAYLFELAMKKMGTSPDETLMVGDRLETDILGGQNAGCKTALVLSGVTERARAEAWLPKVDFIAENLGSLLGL
ncbi:MAG: HAD-IIA family hydrolase [Anaerolineae bacterium]|jgi:4-nitrophenyl phosphatase|nr:HAD-IIA family hydrolase [Anaerolineae bacterium]MBT7073487.1 HAD-IIA family hydrolase [Anaerolineae bacterium]MBT7783693.1 HAD-IIA family hydrolase [Anaerolineae bacterium]